MTGDINQIHLKCLSEIPAGWKELSVADVVEIVSTNKKKLAQRDYLQVGGYPVIDQGQEYVSGFSDDSSLLVDQDPPFIVFGDHTRVFKYVTCKFVPGADGVKVLKPGKTVDPKWCYFAFQAIRLPDKGYARHFQYLKEANLPVPPIAQQKQIVAKIEELFSHIDAGIDALKQSQQLLKQYRQSVLKAAVTGELSKEWREQNKDKLEPASKLLERIEERRKKWAAIESKKGNSEAKRILGKLNKKKATNYQIEGLSPKWTSASLLELCHLVVDCHNKTAPYVESGIPLVRTSNIKGGEIIFDEKMRFINEETYDYWARRCPPEPGDILFTREAPMGESAIIPKNERVCMGQRMMLLRVFYELTDVNYLHAAMMSMVIQQEISSLAVGVGVQHMRVGDVESLVVPVPPLEEQRFIAEEINQRLAAIQGLEKSLDSELQRSERLKQSVLQSAFSGNILKDVKK